MRSFSLVFKAVFAVMFSVLSFSGCATLDKSKSEQSALPDVQYVLENPMGPDQSKAVIKEVGSNWLYGQGIGETALNAGAIFAFPPYGLLVLGNLALNGMGYESVGFTNLLPEEARNDYLKVYDGVTSVPGQITSKIAGKEFVTKEKALENIKKQLSPQDEEYFPYGSNPL